MVYDETASLSDLIESWSLSVAYKMQLFNVGNELSRN